MLPVAAVFLIWDAIAIAAHVWWYNPRYILGVRLPGDVPLEEVLFFLVIPLCGLLTYSAVDSMLSVVRRRHAAGEKPMSGLGYTLPAVLAVLAVCALELGVLRTGLFRRPAYWISMVIVVGFQILVDGWLTKLSAPIVIYDEQHTSGDPVSVRHPDRGFPVRFRAGDRSVVALGAAAAPTRDGGAAMSQPDRLRQTLPAPPRPQ